MLKVDFKYENNAGDVLDFASGELYADPQSLLEWALSANTSNNVLRGFSAKTGSSTLTCAVPISDSAMEMRDKLHDVPSYDLENSTPGKIYLNDWYKACYVSGASIEQWRKSTGFAMFSLTVTNTEDDYWYRDTEYNYDPNLLSAGEDLDYAHDFAHDYSYGRQLKTVINENYLPSDILIRIYGETSNPSVTLGGNTYSVNVELLEGERLEIDTRDKTVLHYDQTGASTSVFANIEGEYMTGSGSYIFEKLSSGEYEVSWSQEFAFDVVVHEKRLVPRYADFVEEKEAEVIEAEMADVGASYTDATPTEEESGA